MKKPRAERGSSGLTTSEGIELAIEKNPMESTEAFLKETGISERIAEDPLLRFIGKYWQHVVFLVAACVIISYAFQAFQSTRENSLKTASERYARVRSEFTQLEQLDRDIAKLRIEVAKEPLASSSSQGVAPAGQGGATVSEKATRLAEKEKKRGEAQARFDQTLQALADSKEPYKRIAKLYGILSQRLGGAGAPAGAVAASPLDVGVLATWEQSGGPTSAERFFGELEALIVARALLDVPERLGEGVAALKALATRGSVARVSAAISLAQLAQSPNERAEARTLLEAIRTQQPEQSDQVRDEIARLK